VDVYFTDKDLIELYEKGTSRKLKLPKEVISKFFALIQKIQAANDIYDLWNDTSLHFKKYTSHYSMRLNDKYRLESEVEWSNKEKTVGEFHIFKISNHYED